MKRACREIIINLSDFLNIPIYIWSCNQFSPGEETANGNVKVDGDVSSVGNSVRQARWCRRLRKRKKLHRISRMIRRAIRTGTARMHKCTRGCVVLFRGATGVGTHGLPTRSRVSDLTGRVIDAAISPAAPRRSLCRRCSISRPREARFYCVFDDATATGYLFRAFRGYGRCLWQQLASKERQLDGEREKKPKDESFTREMNIF